MNVKVLVGAFSRFSVSRSSPISLLSSIDEIAFLAQAGRTALHWASRCGDLDLRDQLVSLLTSKGADKNAKDSVNCSAISFLHLHPLDFRMGTYLNTTLTMISLTKRDNLAPMKIPSQRVILCK